VERPVRRSSQSEGGSGHFWQGRFGAVAMDEEHLAAAVRYVSLNPVRARLVERAQDWRWSSTRAHLRGRDDGLTELAPIKQRFPILPICWRVHRR
jgi:putative transposase